MSDDAKTPTDPRLIEAEVEVKRAEADKARAEARKERVTARKLAAECAAAVAHARKARYQAREYEMNMAEYEEAHKAFTLSDHNFKIYRFTGSVTDKAVAQCVAVLTYWSRSEPGCAMEIEIMSEGGSVIAGMALFDHITSLVDAGHEITTVARGWAASMAAIILQAGSKRVMGRQTSLMIHEASFGAEGKTGDVEDTLKWVKQLQNHIVDIFVERSEGKLNKAEFTKNWKRKDWWVDSETALKLGLVDEIK